MWVQYPEYSATRMLAAETVLGMWLGSVALVGSAAAAAEAAAGLLQQALDMTRRPS
jgi:hypothetical protein